jgi:CRISPR/Cas system-associated endonuclease Cas1
MVEITLPIVLQIFQTVGILVGIVYYITSMRNTQKTRELSLKTQEHTLETRQSQLFMNIYNQSFTNPQFFEAHHRVRNLHWEDLDEYLVLFDYMNPETRDNRLAMSVLIGFYEGVGVLVKENLLDIRMVALLMTGPVKEFWEKIAPVIEDEREHSNYPRYVSETEYLYNELMKYISEHPEFKI